MIQEMVEGLLASTSFIAIFALLVLILWIFLPLAVFGTKSILTRILVEQHATNDRLDRLAAELAALRRGAEMIRFRGTATANDKIAQIADANGAVLDKSRAAPLDLSGIGDPGRACLGWLGRR